MAKTLNEGRCQSDIKSTNLLWITVASTSVVILRLVCWAVAEGDMIAVMVEGAKVGVSKLLPVLGQNASKARAKNLLADVVKVAERTR